MRRASTLLLTALLLLLGSGGAAAAQSIQPFSATAKAPMDLAAMQLLPADLAIKGASYLAGRELGLTDLATSWQPALKDARYRFGLESFLGAGTGAHDPYVSATLYAFAGPRSATAGYQALVKLLAANNTPAKGGKRIGSESTEFTGTHENSDGSTSRRLAVLFREGQIVAIVASIDFSGSYPSRAGVERLGGILAKRIAAGEAGTLRAPGLSRRVVRLTGPNQYGTTDTYVRLAGKDVAGPGAITDRALYDRINAGAIDIYSRDQIATGADANEPSVHWDLASFPSAQSAAAWLKRQFSLEATSANKPQVKVIASQARFGDETRMATLHFTRSNGEPIYDIEIVARYGKVGISLTVEAHQQVDAQTVESLMKVEDGCLRGAAACAPIPTPDAFSQLSWSGPSGQGTMRAWQAPVASAPESQPRA